MFQLRAARRLLKEILADAAPAPSTGEATEVEAQFDGSRDNELKAIQKRMRAVNILFSPGMHHLFHKSNPADVTKEAESVSAELNAMGYALKISPGVYSKPNFALKGNDGLILQKVMNSLRIFFSI